jgi:chromosome segregation ATPase
MTTPAATAGLSTTPGLPLMGMPGLQAPPKTAMPPAMPPGMPPMAAPSGIEQRLQEMDRRFQEQENSKKTLEDHVNELQRQLKDEHEKVILQSLKAREEEALAGKVEQQLREMQEKLRREKYEQELHESRSKAESQLKELERRIAEERETWMGALKNQLKERETVEHEVEQTLTRRLHDFEQRYQDEKNHWAQALRQKDEEMAQLRRQLQLELETMKGHLEEKDEAIEEIKESSQEERRALEQKTQGEVRLLQSQIESQMREASSWKAQIALLQNQLHQMEAQYQEDRNRWQGQMAAQSDELKREFARRDQERAQHWENAIAQIRTEKDGLRNTLLHREEEIARQQMEISQARRDLEVERSHWQAETERIRREAKESAEREMPLLYKDQMESELRKWEDDSQRTVRDLKTQITQAQEAKQAAESQRGFEQQRLTQELAQLQGQLQRAAEDRGAAERDITGLQAQLQQTEEAQNSLIVRMEAKERELQETRNTLDRQKAMWVEEMKRAQEDQQRTEESSSDLQTQLQQMTEQHEAQIGKIAQLEHDLQETRKTLDRQKAFSAEETKRSQGERESQTKEFLHRLAEAQLREATLREGYEKATQALEDKTNEARQALQTLTPVQETLQHQSASLLKAGRMLKELFTFQAQAKAEMEDLRRNNGQLLELQVEVKAREQELEQRLTMLQQKETEWSEKEDDFNQQSAQWSEKETEWAAKESEWDQMKTEWADKGGALLEELKSKLAEKESEMAALSNELQQAKTVSSDVTMTTGGPLSPQTVQAITAIRQQMHEMQTLLLWLRPAKKPLGKAA